MSVQLDEISQSEHNLNQDRIPNAAKTASSWYPFVTAALFPSKLTIILTFNTVNSSHFCVL